MKPGSLLTGLLTIASAILFFGSATKMPAATAADFSREKEVAAVPKAQSADDKEVKAILEWNLKTLLADYNSVGSRNDAWDAPARKALEGFARMRSNPEAIPKGLAEEATAAVKKAVEAGCDDPLVLYLHSRFVTRMEEGMTDQRLLEVMRPIALKMEKSQYHSLRKFYVSFRTALQVGYIAKTNASVEFTQLFRAATTHLRRALRDSTIPISEIDDAWKTAQESKSKKVVATFAEVINKGLADLGRTNALSHLIRGEGYIASAWASRGGAVADKVTEAGWEGFTTNLANAADELNTAWRLDPSQVKVALEMMRVELGQGMGRERMELWFNRAMELNTNSWLACSHKLYYLEPKWHGTPEAMLAFGRECVQSKRWGGEVPTILVKAHDVLSSYYTENQRTSYWKQPGVWADVKAAYEKMLAMSPENNGWRHNYALYAYRCERWDDLNKQIPLLGKINYDFFGGKTEWDKIAAAARQHK